MKLFSKFNVSHSLFQRNSSNMKYLVALPQQGLCSIQVDKIHFLGDAYSLRTYATVTNEKQEIFFPLNNKTSLIANKVALVVGGSQQMGIQCIKNLLSSGAKAIMVADTDEEEGRNVICKLSEEYGEDRTAFIKTDLAKIKLLRNAFNWTMKYFKSIDIVINIAKPIQSESWQEQLDQNVGGIVRGTLLGIEYMGRHNNGKGGSVFNIVTSSPSNDAEECPVLVGARHFVIGFGRSMSRCYAKDTGVKVVTLCAIEGDTDVVTEEPFSLIQLAKSGSVWST